MPIGRAGVVDPLPYRLARRLLDLIVKPNQVADLVPEARAVGTAAAAGVVTVGVVSVAVVSAVVVSGVVATGAAAGVSAVGATGAGNARRLAEKCRDCAFQYGLDRLAMRLDLPAMIVRAVVFESYLDVHDANCRS